MTVEAAGVAGITAPPCVAIFARAPVAGYAKTRLIPRLGPEGAAELQRLLIARTMRTALAAGLGPVSIWCAPDCSHPLFGAIGRESGVSLYAQRGADLGARMVGAFDMLCGAGSALLVGTDCPALTVAMLRDAARCLSDGDDAVFIPAEDGGYVLIGLRRSVPSLFDAIEWGTDRVMAQTRERLRESRLRWVELAPCWDVDRPQDVDRLRATGMVPQIATSRR
jgi:rSAM/selenodomain-associated transferase 1